MTYTLSLAWISCEENRIDIEIALVKMSKIYPNSPIQYAKQVHIDFKERGPPRHFIYEIILQQHFGQICTFTKQGGSGEDRI